MTAAPAILDEPIGPSPLGTPALAAGEVPAAVAEAARPVTATWPIDTFVATNPLAWLEDRPFAEALAASAEVFGPHRGIVTPAEALDRLDGGSRAAAVDDQVATWCRLVVDEHATWAVPGRSEGLWAAWRTVAAADRRLSEAGRRLVRSLPTDPAEAVARLLADAGVSADGAPARLRAHLTALPGWTALLRGGHRGRPGVDLVAYAALRLAVERLVLGAELTSAPVVDAPPTAAPPSAPDASGVALPALDAAEAAYRRDLLHQLGGGAAGADRETPPDPPVQLLCCIDVRSEGLRRHVERLAGWETFGVAGFFGVAVRLHRDGEAEASDRCPVIVTPALEAREVVDRPVRDLHSAGDDAFHAAKEGVGAPLALAEVAGWGEGLRAAWRTFAPGRGPGAAASSPGPSHLDLPGATVEERIDLAHGLLRTVGLVRFAPLVVLCGHGSSAPNNPYAAALACGACGGHPGGANARLAAALLEDPEVRAGLAARGVAIPATTRFVAAEHDTATDEVTLLDRPRGPESLGLGVDGAGVESVLAAAGVALRAERAESLPGGAPVGTAPRHDGRRRRRGQDWAEAVPEWGLAGNAAMVIGPRSTTAGVDLGRRVFLHSYEAAQDPDGAVLRAIFGGPLVVAHWISSQYLFSSLLPDAFGAGTKATHNPIGDLGVLAGPSGDLRRGLPLQSVAMPGCPGHEPLRLLAVVEAPLDAIDAALDATPAVAQLVRNGWMALAARCGPGEPWSRRTDDGWEAWS